MLYCGEMCCVLVRGVVLSCVMLGRGVLCCGEVCCVLGSCVVLFCGEVCCVLVRRDVL